MTLNSTFSTEINIKEIISSLEPVNGKFFHIADIEAYANKIINNGKCVAIRNYSTSDLMSYVLYYDNGPELFISMVWTKPNFQGLGYAKSLLNYIIESTTKDICLEVNKSNPAKYLYERLKFVSENEIDDKSFMRYVRRLCIMQPYFFPYSGYFNLLKASDLTIFYDDVNYIKGGWINRNKILLNANDFLFVVPVESASQNKLINQIVPILDSKFKNKFYKQLKSAYGKAPYFNSVFELITNVLEKEYTNIGDLAIESIVSTYNYLDEELKYLKSSECSPETRGLQKADRLIEITKNLGYRHYVNASGGKDIYTKEYFKSKGIELSFVVPEPIFYKQFSSKFTPWLSIIDILMFNDKDNVKKIFNSYELE